MAVLALLTGGLAATGMAATAAGHGGHGTPPAIVASVPRIPAPSVPSPPPLPGTGVRPPHLGTGILSQLPPIVQQFIPVGAGLTQRHTRAPQPSQKPSPPIQPTRSPTPNQSPAQPIITVAPIANQQGTAGQAVSLPAAGTDSAGEPLTWQAQLPPGLAIDPVSGLITGTLTTAGSYQCAVAATDTSGSYGGTAFTWTVTPGISLINPGDQSGIVGQAVSLQITASNPAGEALSFSAAGLPPGLGIDPATGLISGTLTTAGTYPVTVTATETSGATSSASFTWTAITPPPTSSPPTSPPPSSGSPTLTTP